MITGVISSRTPEGRYGRCPVCREFICIEPSEPTGDAPCPCCGHLIWFTTPLLPIHHEERARNRTVSRRLGRLVARVTRRVRQTLRSIAPARSRRHGPADTPSSSSGVWDRWLDG